jgi:protein arginine N-methyltransferase 3
MHLFGVCDKQTHDEKIKFWSDVYGFRMSCMRRLVVNDAQVLTLEPEHVVTDLYNFKEIDCMTVTVPEVSKFQTEFVLNVKEDTALTGIAASFDTFFNHEKLGFKSSFSTSPFHKTTHWQQTLFQLEEPVNVKKGKKILLLNKERFFAKQVVKDSTG